MNERNANLALLVAAEQSAREAAAMQSAFGDAADNQGRGPTSTAWRITDALIASLFVAVVAWVALGCPT